MSRADVVAVCVIATLVLPGIGVTMKAYDVPQWKLVTRKVLLGCFWAGLVITTLISMRYI